MVTTVNSKLNGRPKETCIRSIVIVEDDEDIADSIRYNLEHQGFRVRVASTGQAALDIVFDSPPNLILLDINLPGMSGFELCRRLRTEAVTARVPILILTARTGESDKVLGLELGADDYLTKPFGMRELLARVSAILRRADGPETDGPIYDDGILVIDPWTFRVTYEGREVRLTRKEMRLLEELARNQGRVMMREVLLDRIWGLRYYGDSRTLDVHIRRLRMKLGNSDLIETITGVGYRLIGSHAKPE
jgi:two-component system, OmpR family, alkaline phosphatase synthesis response regulator PhoP